MSDIQQAIAQPVAKKRHLIWKFLLFVIFSIVLLVISLPYVIEKVAINWLNQQGVEHAEIKKIDINFLQTSFALDGLVLDDALKLAHLNIKLDVPALIKKNIVIKSFRLDNVSLNLSQNSQQVWQLAGIPLTAKADTNSVQTKEEQVLWPVYIKDIQLSDVLFTAKGKVEKNAIDLVLPLTSLHIEGLRTEPAGSQQLNISLKLGELAFNGFTYQIKQKSLQLDSKISLPEMGKDFVAGINIQDINLFSENLNIIKQQQVAFDLVLAKASLNINDVKIEPSGALRFKTALNLQELAFNGFGYQLNQKSLQLDSKISLPEKEKDFATGLKIQDTNLVSQHLSIIEKQNNLTLTIIDKLSLKNASMLTANKMRFEHLLLNSVTLPKTAEETLGKFDKLILSNADLDFSGNYQFDKLLLDNLQLDVIKQKNGEFSVVSDLKTLPKEKKTAEKSKQATAKSTDNKVSSKAGKVAKTNIYVNEFSISKGSRIFLQDQSLEPTLSNTFQVEKFNFSPLDLSGVKKAKLDALFNMDNRASLAINGETTLNSEMLEVDMKVLLKNFDMLMLSSFVESDYGYSVVSGQMDLDTRFKLNNDQIDAKNKLMLRNLTLEKAQHINKPNKKLPMPLGTALDMLRDDRGDISMNVPITGNINDPNINIDDVINKALSSTLSSSVSTYAKIALQPYGAILMLGEFAMGLAKEAAKPRLTAINFDIGSAKLSSDMQQYTVKIAELMQNKPLRLQLCGVATAKERELPENEKAKTDEQLLALAKARADEVIKAIERNGINSERLFRCKATIDESNVDKSTGINTTAQALPRVELILD